MANPIVPQGSLNRLRASFICPNFPALNLTSPYLSKRGISIAFDNATTDYHDTMTGGVTSPSPYIKVTATLYLVKTLPPAAAFKAQMESSSVIGAFSIITDSPQFPDYDLHNGSIMTNLEQSYAGDMESYAVTLGGYYLINSALFLQG